MQLVQFGQGFLSLAAPTAELERLVISRASGMAGIQCCAGMRPTSRCVRIRPTTSIKPNKERSNDQIDGISAFVNALGRALLRDNSGYIYDGRTMLILDQGQLPVLVVEPGN